MGFEKTNGTFTSTEEETLVVLGSQNTLPRSTRLPRLLAGEIFSPQGIKWAITRFLSFSS